MNVDCDRDLCVDRRRSQEISRLFVALLSCYCPFFIFTTFTTMVMTRWLVVACTPPCNALGLPEVSVTAQFICLRLAIKAYLMNSVGEQYNVGFHFGK